MYGFISKLLISGKLKFTEGQINLLGRPVCVVPISFYREICKKANEDPEFMRNIYLDAWEAGLKFCHTVNQHYKIKTFEDRYKLAMDVISMAGFGDYATQTFEKGKYTNYTVLRNPLAKMLHPSEKPVDHMLRGFNAGGGTAVHLKITNSIEPECLAVNGKHCKFLNGTKEFLEQTDSDLMAEQLGDLDDLIRKENSIINDFGISDIVGN